MIKEIKKIALILLIPLSLSGVVYWSTYLPIWVAVPFCVGVILYIIQGIANFVVYENWKGR